MTGQCVLQEDGAEESATLKERCEVADGCREAWMLKRATMSWLLSLERMRQDAGVPGKGHSAPAPKMDA
jgi:hypothetical protein